MADWVASQAELALFPLELKTGLRLQEGRSGEEGEGTCLAQ